MTRAISRWVGDGAAPRASARLSVWETLGPRGASLPNDISRDNASSSSFVKRNAFANRHHGILAALGATPA